MQDAANLWSALLKELQEASGIQQAAILIAIIAGGFLLARSLISVQSQPTPQQKQQKRSYSASEVAQHCHRDSLWIILKGKVYDVTPYIEEHPGGNAILRNAGHDSTEGFYGPQHPERVFDLIDDFFIGDLED